MNKIFQFNVHNVSILQRTEPWPGSCRVPLVAGVSVRMVRRSVEVRIVFPGITHAMERVPMTSAAWSLRKEIKDAEN